MKRRQREVSLANEIYCKLLVEALPSLYEGPKIYSRCNVLQDQEQIGCSLFGLNSRLLHRFDKVGIVENILMNDIICTTFSFFLKFIDRIAVMHSVCRTEC